MVRQRFGFDKEILRMAASKKGFYQRLQEGTPLIHNLYKKSTDHDSNINIGRAERLVSGISGGALVVTGLKKGGWPGLSLLLLGGGLLHRGLTGHCYLYDTLRMNTAAGIGRRASVKHGEGIKVEQSVTINRSPMELYRFWRNFENLPHFMKHLESVQMLDNNLSHWVVKAPAGMTVEWDAQIINEKENELIAWRSLEGANLANAGSVQFKEAPNGRGTILKASINYDAPAGLLGMSIAKLFGEEPGQQIEDDLRRFKQLMESGEIPSTEGQASARQEKNSEPHGQANRARAAKAAQSDNSASQFDDNPPDLMLSHGR
jgi:uncharacterized membrane protein